MLTLLFLSLFSVVGIAIILSRSNAELAPIEVSLVTHISNKVDLENRVPRFVARVRSFAKITLLWLEHLFHILLDILLRWLKPSLNRLHRWSDQRFALVMNAVKGKGSYNKKGSASIFLKQLSSDGKIESLSK